MTANGMAAIKMYGRMMDTVKMAPRTINDNWCEREEEKCRMSAG